MKITYVHHSSFLAELSEAYLLFDYTQGKLPQLAENKPLLVLASHRHGDHFSPVIFDLLKERENIRFLLSDDIRGSRLTKEALAFTDFVEPGETVRYEIGAGRFELSPRKSGVLKRGVGLTVSAYESTDEGVAFLIHTERITLYHAGDLNNWRWAGEPDDWNAAMGKKYGEQVDLLAGMHVDVAFLPLDPRQEEYFYLGLHEFVNKVDVDHIFPMHCWGDFSVIGRLKAMACAAGYKDRLEMISGDGEVFELSCGKC